MRCAYKSGHAYNSKNGGKCDGCGQVEPSSPKCKVRRIFGFTFRYYSSGSWYLWGPHGQMIARYFSGVISSCEPQAKFKCSIGGLDTTLWGKAK